MGLARFCSAIGGALAELELSAVNTAEHVAVRAELGLDEVPRWSLALRFAFRFVFCFYLLWLFPSPLDLIPWLGDKIVHGWSAIWQPQVRWFGAHLLGITATLEAAETGSGDTIFAWTEAAWLLVLSSILTLLWSILDRRRPHYRRLWGWMRIFLRFNLATAMFGYGFAKVIKTQFPDLGTDRLGEKLGDFSPMGLLWTFMGYSRPYTFFAGACEVLGGALLVFRRTTALGCLVIAGVMTNVFLLNLSYDVPVKLYSFELLATALVLLAPDLRRLANVLLLNKPAAPVDLRPPYTKRWMIGAGLALRLLAFGWIAWHPFAEGREIYARAHPAQKSALGEGWAVDKMEFVGSTPAVPPPLWIRIAFHGEWLSARTDKDTWLSWKLEQDLAAKQWKLHPNPNSTGATELVFDWTQPDPDHLLLRGAIGGAPVQIRLVRADPGSFPLMARGFHWVNETPYNR